LNKVINCLVNHNEVINKKLKEVSIEEGRTIATKLFSILNKRKDGIGLAANQVGIDAQVAVVNVREPLILINPKIIKQWDKIPYYEGCLSYPGDGIHTTRYKHIHITTAQEDSGWYFSGVENVGEGKGSWEAGNKDDEQLRLLETICVQHEIDHLNGITIHNRESKPEPVISKKVPGRNEPCSCGSGKKFKKCCM